MYRYDDVTIRKFSKEDIPLKVEWVNDPRINAHLHFDVPISVEGTTKWFENTKDRDDRADMTILYNGIPVGISGILSIDRKNSKAEYYCTLGDLNYQHKGIATKAMMLTLAYAFKTLGLNKIYSTIEMGNAPSIALSARCNAVFDGILKQEMFKDGKYIDVIHMSVLSENFVIPEGMYEE